MSAETEQGGGCMVGDHIHEVVHRQRSYDKQQQEREGKDTEVVRETAARCGMPDNAGR